MIESLPRGEQGERLGMGQGGKLGPGFRVNLGSLCAERDVCDFTGHYSITA